MSTYLLFSNSWTFLLINRARVSLRINQTEKLVTNNTMPWLKEYQQDKKSQFRYIWLSTLSLTWYANAFMIIWYGTRPRGWISFIRTLAGIIWKFMKSRNVPNTSVKLWFVESQYFLLHIKAAWNLINSSAFNSSRDMISLTMCWGNKVNDPKLRTSFPWSSTNSKTWKWNIVWRIYLEKF